MTDLIIVGQGIAGTLLAHRCLREGKNILVIDKGHEEAASRVAAGIMNPVTGRRFSLSWEYPALTAHALPVYRQLEELLGTGLLKERKIIRSIAGTSALNDWDSRLGDPLYQPYVDEQVDWQGLDQIVRPAEHSCQVKGSWQLDIGEMCRLFRKRLERGGILKEEVFDHGRLSISPEGVQYRDIRAAAIVFCEGAGGANNPLFSWLPFKLSKGEVFHIRLKEEFPDLIYKNRIFLLPVPGDRLWAGSYNTYSFEGHRPTDGGAVYMRQQLSRVLKLDYRALAHEAAVRPTVKHRKPLLGHHPGHRHVYIFNGLGTKGSVLAPFFADQIFDFINKRGALWPEADIGRYSDLYR